MARPKKVDENQGRFAIMHAGALVIPRRCGFETEDAAVTWAQYNYRGPNWEVVQLTVGWRKTRSHPIPNGECQTSAEGTTK